MLSCQYKTITVPKMGNSDDENEDQFSVSSLDNGTELRFALADGATESSFSKEWASCLVAEFQHHSSDIQNLQSLVTPGRKKWGDLIRGIEMPWYAEQKALLGAFATFIGLSVDCVNKTSHCYAIGDCCLFQIRENELAESFPISKSSDYGNTPDLIGSIMVKGGTENWSNQLELDIIASDSIILATDAIAAWMMRLSEQGERPWNQLINLLSFEDAKIDFINWLNQKRKEQEIKNDDVTLLIINFK